MIHTYESQYGGTASDAECFKHQGVKLVLSCDCKKLQEAVTKSIF